MGEGDGHNIPPLFESKEAQGKVPFRVFSASIFVGVLLIWAFRASHAPGGEEMGRRWIWYGMLVAEIWFGIYWFFTLTTRWRPIHRFTFKERLSQRHEGELPAVDVFVCTAEPTIEPPLMVINTALSVMAYDYPLDRLAVYLSDDGGSHLTFYALWEASLFARRWVPFCRRFKVEPRAPAAYFAGASQAYDLHGDPDREAWSTIKKLYEEMVIRIEKMEKVGKISLEIQALHPGFSEWIPMPSPRNHQTILQILIDGRDPSSVDDEGFALPTLVYLAREKRPQYHHHFKAGALNALLRVSSQISNGPIILTLDCDMYSNNAEAVRDAVCFFMDEEMGHDIGFVQYPQRFINITPNDIYNNSLKAVIKADFPGYDAYGGPPYIGTACFLRRESLYGEKYSRDHKAEWRKQNQKHSKETMEELEEKTKILADCNYELGSQWGKEKGAQYECLVEDIATGLAIHCKGWRSVFSDPQRDAFLGVAPATLLQTLVQQKRWTEGHLQLFFSRRCPFIQGFRKTLFLHKLAYCIYDLWPLNSIPTLYYASIPSLCLLNGFALFPEMKSLWFFPFIYVVTSSYVSSFVGNLSEGQTLKTWWNEQRMWLYRRISSYLFSVIDATLSALGIAKSAFDISSKVENDEILKRYEQEIMEFGSASPLFVVIAIVAMINLICFGGALIKKVLLGDGYGDVGQLILQFALCASLVIINAPVYEGLFWRKDNGALPFSVAFKSTALALLACLMALN